MYNLQRILISGEGGQGVQTIAKVLVEAAYDSGQKALYVPNYGVEQRGGVSLGFVQISNREIGFPKFQDADILVILAERAIERVREYITKDTVVIYDETLVSSLIIPAEAGTQKSGVRLTEELAKVKNLPHETIAIPALKSAEETMTGKVMNIVVLGFLANRAGGISLDRLKKTVHESLNKKYEKNPELKHFNERALEIGMREIPKSLWMKGRKKGISV